jgi:hypothetical protein
MSAPRLNVPLPWPVEINLSRPAIQHLIDMLHDTAAAGECLPPETHCEVDNFVNLLHNLLDRSEPETQNLDLTGEMT